MFLFRMRTLYPDLNKSPLPHTTCPADPIASLPRVRRGAMLVCLGGERGGVLVSNVIRCINEWCRWLLRDRLRLGD